jgi:hypothetical protein
VPAARKTSTSTTASSASDDKAVKVDDTTASAPETKDITAESPAAPDVAPLEPPGAPTPPPEPEPVPHPVQIIPEHLADLIVDDATGEPPTDVEAVFQPVLDSGSVYVCTLRLVEHANVGPYESQIVRLLLPIGAQVQHAKVERVKARLRAQLNAAAGQGAE